MVKCVFCISQSSKVLTAIMTSICNTVNFPMYMIWAEGRLCVETAKTPHGDEGRELCDAPVSQGKTKDCLQTTRSKERGVK